MAATFTTSDLCRKSGDIIAEALRRPVTITQRNKPRLVILSYEDFEALRKAHDQRKAYKLKDMPDDSFALLKAGFEAYKNDGGEP